MMNWLGRLMGWPSDTDLREREEALEQRQEELQDQEEALTAREDALVQREAEFKKHKQELADQLNWRLVHTEAIGVTKTEVEPETSETKYLPASYRTKKTSGKFYYQMYESADGHRKVEYGMTIPGYSKSEIAACAPNFEFYHEAVIPWLGGRSVEGIPTYRGAEMEDVQAKLSK